MSGRLVFWVLVPCLGLALVAQTMKGANWIAASRAVQEVEERTVQIVSLGRSPAGVLHANVVELERAAKRDPGNVAVLIGLGSQYLLMRAPEAAIDQYERSLRLEPRPEIYLNLARAQLMQGQRAKARRNFRLALRLSSSLRPQVPREFRH